MEHEELTTGERIKLFLIMVFAVIGCLSSAFFVVGNWPHSEDSKVELHNFKVDIQVCTFAAKQNYDDFKQCLRDL